MKHIILIAILSMFNLSSSIGQDPYFTQSNSNPMSISPINAGGVNEENRIIFSYRNQYNNLTNGFNTFSASYDHRFTVGKHDFWGTGLVISRDHEIGHGKLSTSSVILANSYWKQLHSYRRTKGFLIGGLSAGVANQSFDESLLTWSEQFKETYFDMDLNSGEQFVYNSRYYFDLNAGLSYFAFEENKWSFKLGGALHHVNRPNVSFGNNINRLKTKITIHGSGFKRIELNRYNAVFFYGRLIYQQQAALKVLTPQFRVGFELNDNQFIDFGIGSKVTNNISATCVETLTALCKFRANQNIIFDLSYDFTVSSNAGKGAFEIAISYLFRNKTKRGVYCPRSE